MKAFDNYNMIEKMNLIIKLAFNRNGYIYHDLNRKVKKNHINIHYWKRDENTENVGDYLAQVVCKYMAEYYNLDICSTVSKTKHLYSIGSGFFAGLQDATIWGTGILKPFKGSLIENTTLMYNKYFRRLDIRLVRGPNTYKYLIKNGISCPQQYGDPAILMPLIYQPHNHGIKRPYALIPHHSVDLISADKNNILSPITCNYQSFIDFICESELVISGSLHGIILAEAYGRPAIFLRDRMDCSMFKYEDYYYSTGRTSFPIANSVDEALHMTASAPPNFEQMQKTVIATFPVDLWD